MKKYKKRNSSHYLKKISQILQIIFFIISIIKFFMYVRSLGYLYLTFYIVVPVV